jgi:hypothetical protein
MRVLWEPLAALLRPSDCTAMRLMLAAEAGGDAAKAATSAARLWWLTSCGRMHILCSHKSENVWGRSAGASISSPVSALSWQAMNHSHPCQPANTDGSWG